MNSTRVSHHIQAPRSIVFEALLDAGAVATWIATEGITSWIHAFDPSEGGVFRFSLACTQPDREEATPLNGTFHGLFVKVVPNERVVELLEIESEDKSLRGKMMVTITLTDLENGGTEIIAVHSELPPGLDSGRVEAGWRTALDRLAQLTENAVQHA